MALTCLQVGHGGARRGGREGAAGASERRVSVGVFGVYQRGVVWLCFVVSGGSDVVGVPCTILNHGGEAARSSQRSKKTGARGGGKEESHITNDE